MAPRMRGVTCYMAYVLDLQGLSVFDRSYCTLRTVSSTQTAFRPK
jgi:hypothetical protein